MVKNWSRHGTVKIWFCNNLFDRRCKTYKCIKCKARRRVKHGAKYDNHLETLKK